jgi:RNA polymerase sigma factor (sigma-70 family)
VRSRGLSQCGNQSFFTPAFTILVVPACSTRAAFVNAARGLGISVGRLVKRSARTVVVSARAPVFGSKPAARGRDAPALDEKKRGQRGVRFVEMWELHNDVLYRRCVSLMRGDREAAEEAYSRTAVQAFVKWRRDLRDGDHARAWLLTIARNACVDIYRERRKRAEVSIDQWSDVSAAGPSQATLDPERSYAAIEQSRLVRASIAALPQRLRAAATLHFLRDMPYRDIAQRLGITEATARKRIQQVRERLRSAVRAGW